MNAHKRSKIAASPLWLVLVLLVLFSAGKVSAATIAVPNGDFSSSANNGSAGGLLFSYTDTTLGTGPWHASGVSIASLLLAPTTTIGGGQVTFSGLLSTTVPIVGNIVNNSATLFNNNIGATFVTNQTYTLTADFSSSTVLNLSLLTGAGFGISLRSNGTDVASTAGNVATISLLTGTTGRLTLNYTALAPLNNTSIGISMFVGSGSGLANVGLLSDVNFDNIALSAVPEPSTWAAWAGVLALGAAGYQRRRKQKAVSMKKA